MKNARKNQTMPLRLQRETVRVLGVMRLNEVAGGSATFSVGCETTTTTCGSSSGPGQSGTKETMPEATAALPYGYLIGDAGQTA